MMPCMISLARKHHIASHQHVEFGEARRLHDMRDMNKCIDWFRPRDPFHGNVSGLRQVRVMTSIVKNRRQLAVIYDEVLTVYMSDMQP